MGIHYVSIANQWQSEKNDLLPIIERTLDSGHHVNAEEIDLFEESIAKLCNTRFAIALNSGTDALTLALHLTGVERGSEK